MPHTQRPVASRILSKYEQDRAYRLHRQKLQNIRPNVDNSPPKRFPHLVLRLKQVQKEEEKMAEVDHENKLLLQKMTQIMRTHGRVDNWNEEYEPRSLNHPYKQRQLEVIATENINIARRLENVQPRYKIDNWEEEYQHSRYLQELWRYQTKDYEETPRGRRKRSRSRDFEDKKYDSDFESDEDDKNGKLPSIDGNEKKSDAKKDSNSKKSTQDNSVTKLPKIQQKKSGLNIEHKYEMYWGDYFDPNRTKESPRSDTENDTEDSSKSKTKDKDNKKGSDKQNSDKNGNKKDADGKGNDKSKQDQANESDAPKSKIEMTPLEADAKQLFKVAKQMAKPDDILIKSLVKKSPGYRQQLKRKYQELYDKDLGKDLKQGLGSDWNVLVDELLTDPAEGASNDLHDALEAKDIATIVEILCSNQGNLPQFKETYRKEFATSLEAEVEKKTKAPVQLFLMALLKEGRDESSDVDERKAEKDATVLHEFGDGRWSDKSGQFLTVMESKSIPHIKAVFKQYKNVSGKDVVQSIKEECDEEYAGALSAFVSSTKSPSDMYADRLFKNLDASKPVFVKTLVSRAEIDMPSVLKSYKKKYDADLSEDMDDRCIHPTTSVLKALAAKSPPSKKSKGNKKLAGMSIAPPPKGKSVKRPDNKHGEDDANPLAQSMKKGDNSKKKDKKKEDGGGPKTTGTIFPAKNFNADKDVERLHKAMDGFGTDEQIIIDVLVNKNNEQRQVLKKKYKEKYKKDLVKDLKSELSSDFEELVLALMMEPVEYDAVCVHEAVSGPGTTEAMLIGVICTRNGKEIKAMKEQYRKAFRSDLVNDIRSDTSGDFEELLVELLKGGRDPNWDVNKKEAEEDAKELYKKDKSVKANDEVFKRVMTKLNRLQFTETTAEYKKLANQELVDSISKSMSGDAKDGYVGLAKALENPIKFYAERLHDGFKGVGTNDTRTIRILVSRSEIDLADIKAKYEELYGKSLRDAVESETSGHYRKTLLAIIGENKDKTEEKEKPKETKPIPKPKETKKTKPKTDKSKQGQLKKEESKTGGTEERGPPDGMSDEPTDKSGGGNKEERIDWENMPATGTVSEAKDLNLEESCRILYEAMKGFGTDEESLVSVLTSCNNSQRQALKKAYKNKYKKELTAEIKSEVSGDLEEVLEGLLMTPQDYTVERVHKSMAGLGTDERLLLFVTLTNSSKPQDVKALSKKYKEVYKKELTNAVKSETSGVMQKVLLNILSGKRSQATQVKQADVEATAKKLYGEGESLFKYDVEQCGDILTTVTAAQAKAVFDKYKELSGEDVIESIEKHTAGYPEMALLAVARYLKSPYAYCAHVLHEATAGTGTKDDLLMAVIIGRSEIDLLNIKLAYKDMFGKPLEDLVHSETSGDYRKCLLAILNSQQ